MSVDWTRLCQDNVTRVRAEMQRADIEVLLATKNETTRYLTGYQRYYCASYLPAVHAVLLSLDAGPVLLVPEHIAAFGHRCHATELDTLPLGEAAQARTLASRLRQAAGPGGRIGLEADFLPAGFRDLLAESLDDAKLVDATPLLKRARSRKSPGELALLRESSALADAMVREIFAAAVPGRTERELAGEAAVALRGGAEFLNHLCVRSQENAFELSPVNTDRVLRDGDCLQLDVGCLYEGYVSDVNRTLVLGTPSADQAAIIDTVVEVHHTLLDQIRPGVPVSELYRHCRELFTASQLRQHFRMPFIAHGIGLSLHEYPYVTPDNDALLEPDMVLCLEPGIYVQDRGTCRMENMLLVTDNSNEVLTDLPDDRELNEMKLIEAGTGKVQD